MDANTLCSSLEESLTCSITSMIFLNPVMAMDGNIYECQAIEKWLENNDTSPITREKLPSKNLKPANKIRNMVNDLLQFKPELADNRYVLERKDHKDSISEFTEIYNDENKRFIKIYEYQNFDFKILMDDCYFHKFLMYAPYDVIKYLTDNSTNFKSAKTSGKQTLLHFACKKNEPKLISYLLDQGMDQDVCGRNRDYPIHYLIDNKKISSHEIIKLLEKIKNLEHKDDDHSRPIHKACFRNDYDLTKYLVDRGVKLNCPNKNGWSPIHYLCEEPASTEMITYLLENKKIDLECTTNDGKKPIHLLSAANSLPLIKLMLDRGTKVENIKIPEKKNN